MSALGDWECRVLVTELATGRQDVILTQLLEFEGGHKLRLRIRSDAHKFQCSAKIERHDGNRWQELAHIEPAAMATEAGLVYCKDWSPLQMRAAFDADRESLLDQATLVLLL